MATQGMRSGECLGCRWIWIVPDCVQGVRWLAAVLLDMLEVRGSDCGGVWMCVGCAAESRANVPSTGGCRPVVVQFEVNRV